MFEGLLQPMHLLVILIIALLVFGPKKLPEIGKSLGAGIRGFKDGITDQSTPKQDTTESKTIASEDTSPKS
jgi:sec-independent protein translocase protein TatA